MVENTPSLTSFVVTCSHAQTGHAQASGAFQAAQHTQHTQHAQHEAGFVMPPPPPPAIPNFSSAPRSFAVTAQTDTWNRGEDRGHARNACTHGCLNPKWPCCGLNHGPRGCLFCRHASHTHLKLRSPALACHQMFSLAKSHHFASLVGAMALRRITPATLSLIDHLSLQRARHATLYSTPAFCKISPPKLYLQGAYLPFTCIRPKGRPRAPPHGPRASPGHSSPRLPPPLPLPACSLPSSPSAPLASSHMPTQVCCTTF